MKEQTKKVIKNIVKECLIEILAEGLSDSSTNKKREFINRIDETSKRSPVERKRNSYIDSVTKGIDNSRANEKINNIVSSLTNDNVMSDILKDTANTTLLEQTESRTQQPSILANGDQAAKVASVSDPTELFSESSSKWASLAFADPVKR